MRGLRIQPLVRDIDRLFARRTPASSPALTMLLRYLELVRTETMVTTPELEVAFTNHVCDLLALAIGATRDATELAGFVASMSRGCMPSRKTFAETSASPTCRCTRLRRCMESAPAMSRCSSRRAAQPSRGSSRSSGSPPLTGPSPRGPTRRSVQSRTISVSTTSRISTGRSVGNLAARRVTFAKPPAVSVAMANRKLSKGDVPARQSPC
jgi:hypothetical protein